MRGRAGQLAGEIRVGREPRVEVQGGRFLTSDEVKIEPCLMPNGISYPSGTPEIFVADHHITCSSAITGRL